MSLNDIKSQETELNRKLNTLLDNGLIYSTDVDKIKRKYSTEIAKLQNEIVVQENQDGMDRERNGKGSGHAQDEIA